LDIIKIDLVNADWLELAEDRDDELARGFFSCFLPAFDERFYTNRLF
jgi:hypothetical protein